jgi:hypothetical protein
MRYLCVTFALIVLNTSWVAGQDTGPRESAPDVAVSIPDTAAPPEWELRIPVSVKPADQAGVARMRFKVIFPSPTLEYQSVDATEKLEEAGFLVKAEVPVLTGETGSCCRVAAR